MTPENPRTCKFGSRHLSDDDALELVEQFLVVVETLVGLGDKTEDWQSRRAWLQGLIGELWSHRGLYPGMSVVLQSLKFGDAIPFFKKESLAGREQQGFEETFAVLDGKCSSLRGVALPEKTLKNISRAWKVRTGEERRLLKDCLPRFDLLPEQVTAILSPKRAANGIYASLAGIADNPYLLAEQYVGNDPDDIIPWGRIDRSRPCLPPTWVAMHSLISTIRNGCGPWPCNAFALKGNIRFCQPAT